MIMNRPTLPTYDARDLVLWKSAPTAENGACLEVARVPGSRPAVRDSKVPDGPHFAVRVKAFTALIQFANDGSI